jgi:SWI/SNF-related matrix-associated actin-dependent regulator 1 of chromatin subfamily A
MTSRNIDWGDSDDDLEGDWCVVATPGWLVAFCWYLLWSIFQRCMLSLLGGFSYRDAIVSDIRNLQRYSSRDPGQQPLTSTSSRGCLGAGDSAGRGAVVCQQRWVSDDRLQVCDTPISSSFGNTDARNQKPTIGSRPCPPRQPFWGQPVRQIHDQQRTQQVVRHPHANKKLKRGSEMASSLTKLGADSCTSKSLPGKNKMSLLPPSDERFLPMVSLSRTEPWVNEIMSMQFPDDEMVVFKNNKWTFPFSRYISVVKSLKTENNPNAIEELSPTVVSVLSLSPKMRDDSMRYCHIPSDMEDKLMPFQREGIRFILRRGGRALLGDEMGLGKTVQALGAASAYKDEWPVMIVCPSSLRESWSTAIQEWLKVPERKIRVIHTGKDAEQTVFGMFDFLVISYGFLDKIRDAQLFNIIVVDESHSLKDWTAKRTKVALPILKKAKRVVLLTGTPALNRPKEIFTQLCAVAPKANLKLKDFGERYCEGNRFDKYGGAKNLDELFALLHGSVMVRRLKSEVLKELPRKRRQKVFLGLDNPGKKQLEKLKAQMEESRAALVSSILSGKAGALSGNGVIMEVYKKTAELKVKAVQDYVSTLMEGGGKFLIFAHHLVLLDGIEHACNKASKSAHRKQNYIRIDGSTPSQQRAKMVESFQNDESIQVAILSIKAAGVGLTLTAASTVVFSELTWVPGDLIQAEDRAHRIGQQNSVNVSFLMIKGSIDELIWNTIENKLESLGECLNGAQQSLGVTTSTQRDIGQPSILSYLSQTQP